MRPLYNRGETFLIVFVYVTGLQVGQTFTVVSCFLGPLDIDIGFSCLTFKKVFSEENKKMSRVIFR